MTTALKILNKESELKVLKYALSRERIQYSSQFTDKINKLISSTPSGELRNELTELNILFIAIMETL